MYLFLSQHHIPTCYVARVCVKFIIAMDASINMFCGFNLVIVLKLTLLVSTAAGVPYPRHIRESGHQLPDHDVSGSYVVQCGTRFCDLRQQWCDTVINSCARCDDDCHPGRIKGNRAATEDCLKNCAGEWSLFWGIIFVSDQHQHRAYVCIF